MPNTPNQVDLAKLFQTVATTMASNRESLNQADTNNHDHGDNMVEIFNLISQTMKSQGNATPAEQLLQASRVVAERKSGSAQVYAQGLQRASTQFQGQKFLTPENIMMLIQLLMGVTQKGGQPQGQGGLGDLLGSLLGRKAAAPSTGTGAGRVGGGAEPSGGGAVGGSDGLDLGDLLNAGRAYVDAKQRGGDNMTAIMEALRAGSAVSGSEYRSQSGALVVNSLLQALSGMTAKR